VRRRADGIANSGAYRCTGNRSLGTAGRGASDRADARRNESAGRTSGGTTRATS
jgi:hypothetical protein